MRTSVSERFHTWQNGMSLFPASPVRVQTGAKLTSDLRSALWWADADRAARDRHMPSWARPVTIVVVYEGNDDVLHPPAGP